MNSALALHENIMTLFNMKQRWADVDDDQLNRFILNLKNMERGGGEHLLCSLQLMGGNDAS